MTKKQRLTSISRRAADAGIAMTRLCGLTGIHYASWWRWCEGITEPQDSSLDRLEAQLTKVERA